MCIRSLSAILCFIVISFVGIAQTEANRRPTSNQTVTSGPVIDSREVSDPTLASGKNGTRNNIQQQNTTEVLRALSGSGGLSLSGYQLEQINPVVSKFSILSLKGVNKIRLVDVRTDPYKVGFKPVAYAQRKRGIGSIALQVNQGLTTWLSEDVLTTTFKLDSTSDRQLVMVLNKCWLSNNANKPYTASHPQLIQSLSYSIDLYSSKGDGYFPLKQLNGEFVGLYNKDDANASVLFDSLVTLLRSEISNIQYETKEKEDKLIPTADFKSFYNTQRSKLNSIATPLKGVYASYEDFIAQRITGDSVEMIVQYNNAGRSILYACQIMLLSEKNDNSTAKSWGYFDGRSLYLNLGNGFYGRLIRTGGNYVFYWLENMREDRIKSAIAEGIVVGKSSFNIIKDYARVMPLTYQLDPLTGKLE